MKEQIKQLRLEIDGLAQLCEGLKPIKDGAAIHNRLRGLDLLSIHSTESERAVHKAKYEKEYDAVIRETSRNTEEIKEAVKSLKLSKAWLGKVLESLGSENPYGSGYKTVEDIVPETDKAKTVYGAMSIKGETTPRLKAVDTFTLNGKIMNEYSQMSHIEKVDWLRTKIKSLIERVSEPMNIDLSKISGNINVEKYIEELNSMGIQFIDSKETMGLESLPLNKVKEHLTEARFWLGFELGRVRDESK